MSSRRLKAVVPVALLAIVGLACAGCGSDGSEKPPTLTDAQVQKIEQYQATKPFQQGDWGIFAADTTTKDALFEQNIHQKFAGASTTKNFTVAATFGELGTDYRFKTPVFRLGEVGEDRVLEGDLVLQASGDLTMGGRDEGGDVAYTGFDHMDANEVPGPAELTPQDPLAGLNELAGQVKASGIDQVSGNVAIDDRIWNTKTIGAEVVSPIIVNDNVIDVTLEPGRPGEPVTYEIRPETAAYEVRVETTTGPAGSSLAPEVGQIGGGTAVIAGSIPADADPVVQVVRVPDPPYFGRTLFIEALERAGVRVDAPATAPNETGALPSFDRVAVSPKVAELTSPPVSEFGKLILKVSHNVGSNTAPFWLAVDEGKRNFEAGMQRIRDYVVGEAGVPPEEYTQVDGQGLPENRFSPFSMVTLLDYAIDQPYGDEFADAMPIKGVDGIPDRPEEDPGTGQVVAKNGLLGGLNDEGEIEVQAMALAGYAGSGSSRVAFDVVVNHVPILPNGQSSEDPDELLAAFTRFQPLEGITTEFYLAGQN